MTGSAKKKVVVAMSGGVDSSVAAAMLKDDGYDVVGCFMRLGSPGETLNEDVDQCNVKIGKQGCCSINDAKDAQHVAAKLGIAFYVLNFKQDFGRIIDYFAGEYNAGRTPNPCVRCNDWLKFGKLADYARSIDADYVASGHYARVDTIDGRPALRRGVDASKDQSYVLFGAKLENLRHTLLPVGGYHKSEIRRMAEQFDLPVYDKPDSQEICFVPDMDYARVVRSKTPGSFSPGQIRDTEGNVIGEHEGHQHFTIGQRRGVKVALGYPIYVVNKDAEANTITVGPRDALAAGGCVADQTNWLIDPPTEQRRCDVKIRYNARPVPASVHVEGDRLHVRFDEPQDAVAPGQAVVCYDGDRVLGGGWISRATSGDG
ncbi:tRNA 2-thiouridine(34) synthase MnmA [Planctomycetales bacterium ZRK34]|nr:tRNA 2-thiouridine(34) synthase MnmA [Planctomycetales bacterium ZRK34]